MLHFWKTEVCAVFIFIISAVPGQGVPDVPIWNFDKLVHTLVYFGLALSIYRDLKTFGNGRWSRHASWIAIAFSMGYGGLLEILQHSVLINRSGNWIDFWANTAGAMLVVALPVIPKKRIRLAKTGL